MAHFLADSRKGRRPARSAALPAGSPEAGNLREGHRAHRRWAETVPDRSGAVFGRCASAGMAFQVGLETNAVSSGDVVARSVHAHLDLRRPGELPAPFFDTACPHGWSEALARLDAQGFDSLVPGHGARR